MRNLEVFPYVLTDNGWSISDSVMAAIWLQLEQEGKVEHLFYDGSVKNVTEWLTHMKQPGLYGAVVADTVQAKPVHIVWLKDVYDGVAWAHHTSLGTYRRGVWEAVIDYWSKFNLRLLLGLTPETNKMAVKFLSKICKFQIVGTIPGLCNMAYNDVRVGGVISYYLMGEKKLWVEESVPPMALVQRR